MTGNRPYTGALQQFDNSSYSNEYDATYMRGANFVDGPSEAVQTSFAKRVDTSGSYFSQPALCQYQSVESTRDFSNFYQYHMGLSEVPRRTALYDCHRVGDIERFNNSGGINAPPTKCYSSQCAPFYGSNINIADMSVMQTPYHFPYHGFEDGSDDLSRNNHFPNVNKEVNSFMEYDCGKFSKDNWDKINKEHLSPVLSQRMRERFSQRDDTFMEQTNLTEEADIAVPFSPTCKDSSSFQRPTGTISKAPLWKKWSALTNNFKLNATEVQVKKEVPLDPIEGDDLCRANEGTVPTYSNFIAPFDDYDTRRFHGNVTQENSGFSASSAHSYTTCKTPIDMDVREKNYKSEMSMDGERAFRPKKNDIWNGRVDDSYDYKQNNIISRLLREDVYDAYSQTGNKEKMRSPSNKIAIPFLRAGRAIYKKAELIVEEIKKTMNLTNVKFAVVTEGHQRNNSKQKIGQDCLQNNGNSNKSMKIQNGLSTGTPKRFLKITNGRIVLSLPLDPLENPKDNDELVYVNRKQCDRILKRRIARAKLELSGRVQRWRGTKKYLHESRHLHAVKRSRGKGGRFVKHAQEIKLESLTESDIKSDSPLDEILQGLC